MCVCVCVCVCVRVRARVCMYDALMSSLCGGNPPSAGPSARRADHSLPQPLHLKAVFIDQKDRKASIRFEFVSMLLLTYLQCNKIGTSHY